MNNGKKIAQQVVGSMHDLGKMREDAKGLCKKFGLKNPHFLNNILLVIDAMHMFHDDVVRDKPAHTLKLLEVRRHIDAIHNAAVALRALPLGERAGSIVASMRDPDVFSVLHLLTESQIGLDLETSIPTEPADAMLQGFIKPLGIFWSDSTGEMPTVEFINEEGALKPRRKSASAFIVAALRAAGWDYSNERVATAMVAVIEVWTVNLGSIDSRH